MSARLVELEQGALIGRFRVTREIGRGGHGVVYEARDTLLGRVVALKTVSIRDLTAAQIAAAQTEACLLSQVDSPHVCAIHDLVHHGQAAILVMELVNGPTLDSKVKGTPLPWPEVVSLGAQLAKGLHALHQAGIVHRDIKPSNIRLSRAGLLKIVDLGIARWIGPAPGATRAENTATTVAGTIPYMSPEQLQGHPGDARSDIYGCGAVLYELATGRRIFEAAPPARGRERFVQYARPRFFVPGIPRRIEQVIMRALDPDPDYRFQTAAELLVAVAHGGTIRARRRWIGRDVVTSGLTTFRCEIHPDAETTSLSSASIGDVRAGMPPERCSR